MTRGVILATFLIAYFGLSTPLLFASQAGAQAKTSGDIFLIVDTDPTSLSVTPEVYQFSVSSLEIPVNAFYVVLNYDRKEMSCESPRLNEADFPLLLESVTNDVDGEIIMALAQPGYGLTATTTLGSVECTKFIKQNTPGQIVVSTTSRAYAADGFGTELAIKSR